MTKKAKSLIYINVIVAGLFSVVALTILNIFSEKYRNITMSSEANVPQVTNIETPKPQTSNPVVNTYPAIPPNWITYKNEKYGYSIAYPGTINVRKYSYNMEISEEGNISSIIAKGIDSLGEIEVVKLPIDKAKSEIVNKNKTFSIPRLLVDERSVDLNGYSAKQLLFQDPEKKVDKNIYLLIENKNKTYILSFGLYDSKSEISYTLIGKRIFETFFLINN